MKRRRFLQSGLPGVLAAAVSSAAGSGRRPRILLRNGWQSQNLGDIAHYMGMMELLRLHEVDAEVRFWTSNMGNGADELFRRHFPDVPVFRDRESVDRAFRECDFLLHGSGSGFVAWRDVGRWVGETGRPFGVMGISLAGSGREAVELLKRARFVYFRDGVSAREAVERHGIPEPPSMGWGPDTAFGTVRLRNDAQATEFLHAAGLEEGRFLCVIPRYRWTPFWEVYPDREPDESRKARNDAMKENDHAPWREAIIRVVRETGIRVLVTHEDQTQIAAGRELLVDPLPEDVRKQVVWRDRFHLPDEALSIYVRSLGVVGNEMHSPILCIANGVPALVGRWDEQTTKGFMWRDIGLGDWLFTMDDREQVRRIPETVVSLVKDPEAAAARARAARGIVLARQREQFATLKRELARIRIPE